MQVISGQGNASNILLTAQKRLIRPAYAQTQGFPYAAYLDSSLRASDGSIVVPSSSSSGLPLTYTNTVFTYEGSIVPGTVVVKGTGENVVIANGAANVQPMGLLDQWIGGKFDNVGQMSEIGVWMGPDSTYDLLAPAWNDAGLPAAVAAATPGQQILLYAGTDGRLSLLSSAGGTAAANSVPVARLIQRWNAARITIQLVI